MKRFSFFLLFVAYFLFCNMSCGDSPTHVRLDELLEIELLNIDFSGENMVLTDEKIKKEAYVIGVQCLVNTYRVEVDAHWTTGKLVGYKENTSIQRPIANVEDVDIFTVSDFDDKHPAGSSVKDLFHKSGLSMGVESHVTYTLILRKIPQPGIYSFRVVYTLEKDEDVIDELEPKTIEAVTKPIELY